MMVQQYPMYAMPPSQLRQRRRTPSDVIPGVVPGLLGGLQLILWLAIMGLEAVSVYYDAGRGTIYAGFWCSMTFFITWVSMFCFLCCGQSNGCAIYLLVINAISCIFSLALIIFTNEFVKNPCRCYGYLCSIPAWDDLGNWNIEDQSPWIVSVCTLRTLEKLPYLKGLLACAVLMFLSNLIYGVVYIAVSIWLQCKGNDATRQTNVTFQKQQGTVHFPHQQSYPPYIAAHPSHPSLYRESAPPPPYSQEYLPSAPLPPYHGGYHQAPGRQPAPRYSNNNNFYDDDRF